MERKTQTQPDTAQPKAQLCRPNLICFSKLDTDFTAKYNIECLIGWGGFGTVTKVTRRGSSESLSLACKFIPKSKVSNLGLEAGGKIPMEVTFLKKLRHPNIIKFVDFFQDQTYYYLITECHGEIKNNMASYTQRKAMDLYEYIEVNGFLSESATKKIFKQIISAISYMHSEGIFHGDIKDENILIDEYKSIKLIDFGSAAFYQQRKSSRFLGTIQYASPEILRGELFDGFAAEIWALGCCLYTMLTGQIPFRSKKHALYSSFYPPIRLLSHSCHDLIVKMLEKDPKLRHTVKDVANHEWLVKIN